MGKWGLVVLSIGLPVVIIGVGVSVAISAKNVSDAFVPALTAGLVFITGYYAIATKELVDTTNKGVQAADQQAKIMIDAQHNASAPVMSIKVEQFPGPANTAVTVHWMNVGKGPALNFRCWVEDPQFPQLRNKQNAICRTTIPVAIDSNYQSEVISLGIPQYRLGQGFVKAQYESMFGKTYESDLMFPVNVTPQLEWGEVKQANIIRI
jgi:hypothetical protein